MEKELQSRSNVAGKISSIAAAQLQMDDKLKEKQWFCYAKGRFAGMVWDRILSCMSGLFQDNPTPIQILRAQTHNEWFEEFENICKLYAKS